VSRAEISKCYIVAGISPAGANLIVDVMKNGVSIFGSAKLVLTPGATSATVTSFATTSVVDGDLFTALVAQTGSTVPGSTVSVACRLEL
jgi:hypothetical protein